MRCADVLPLLAAAVLAGCATTAPVPPLAVAMPTLAGQTFGPDAPADVRTLVFVLHDDGPALVGPDHALVAQSIATAVPGTRTVALLRPGYADGLGNRSSGVTGGIAGDSYTADRIAAVADTVAAARRRYPGARTVLVGQSGGAAIAAAIAGTRSDLVDAIVLAGCPCMLPEWRTYMKKRQPAAAFGAPVDSFDPLMTVGGVSPATRVALLVGADDDVTPARFSRAYAEALALRGIATDFRVIPGRGHALLTDPALVDAVRRIATDPAPPASMVPR